MKLSRLSAEFYPEDELSFTSTLKLIETFKEVPVTDESTLMSAYDAIKPSMTRPFSSELLYRLKKINGSYDTALYGPRRTRSLLALIAYLCHCAQEKHSAGQTDAAWYWLLQAAAQKDRLMATLDFKKQYGFIGSKYENLNLHLEKMEDLKMKDLSGIEAIVKERLSPGDLKKKNIKSLVEALLPLLSVNGYSVAAIRNWLNEPEQYQLRRFIAKKFGVRFPADASNWVIAPQNPDASRAP